MNGECIIFRPITIDESVIVSGPPDAEAQVFNGTGLYQTGEEVWDNGHAYRSKIDNNTDDTSVTASWKDLGEVDGGALAWAPGSYDKQDPRVFVVRNHRLYTTAVDANTTEPGTPEGLTKWQDFGPTNRYRAFDENLARFSTSVGSLKWVLQFPETVLHCLVFSPVGSSIRLTKVADLTTIYDRTENLLLDGDVDYWGYFFTAPKQRYNAVFDDMVSIPGETITVEFSAGEDTTVAVSGLHFGSGIEVGPVVIGGTGIGTQGFVTVDFDEFGNLISPARPKQQITRFSTAISTQSVGLLTAEVNDYSQRPCIAFMRDGENFGLLAWGVLDNHDFDFSDPAVALLDIKIKGFPQ